MTKIWNEDIKLMEQGKYKEALQAISDENNKFKKEVLENLKTVRYVYDR